MDKILFDHFSDGIGVQAAATLCIVLCAVRYAGDDRFAAVRRFIRFLDPDVSLFRGPDWFMQPVAAAVTFVYGAAGLCLALCAAAAAWAMTMPGSKQLEATMAFALFMFGMGLCLRMARVGYERAWQLKA